MGGIDGRLFREFAVTLSVAIACIFMRFSHHHPHDVRSISASRKGDETRKIYHGQRALISVERGKLCGGAALGLASPALMLVSPAQRSAFSVYLYIVIPKGVFPQQDTGIHDREYLAAYQDALFTVDAAEVEAISWTSSCTIRRSRKCLRTRGAVRKYRPNEHRAETA